MPSYAQITKQGVVHTVMESKSLLSGVGVIEIAEYDEKYLNCLFDGSIFRKLTISINKAIISVNEVINVIIQWVDVDGNPINYGEDVELRCGDITETITMIDGQGTTTFESAELGEFELIAISPQGVRASIKVVVQ